MAKHRLLLDEEFEYLVYGLSCHQKDYRLAWHLTNATKKKFVRHMVQLTPQGANMESFANFSAEDPDNHLRYALITNYNDSTYLIKQYKQYDYFILVEGYIDIFDSDRFLATLRSIDQMQLVTELDKDLFERFQYALFE